MKLETDNVTPLKQDYWTCLVVWCSVVSTDSGRQRLQDVRGTPLHSLRNLNAGFNAGRAVGGGGVEEGDVLPERDPSPGSQSTSEAEHHSILVF